MKTAKKVLALLLSVLMVFTMVSSSAVAVAETAPAEKTEIEDVESTVTNAFDTVKGIIDGVHNLVGGILSMLDKECVFCDEVHGKAENDDEDTQEPTEPETPPSEPEVPSEPEGPTEPETPVEPEEPTEPEKPKEDETTEDKIGNDFDSIGGLFDSIHNLVGSILAIFGKECPFCDKVHGEDEEDKEDDPDEDGCYTVTFDLNYEGAPEAEKQKVKAGEYVVISELPEREDYVFVGWYTSDKYVEIFNFAESINKNYILYARWINANDKTDTDNDGLTDPVETYLGTNPQKADSDNDGLTDYQELYTTATDPLKADTDANGVNDAEEDFDNDKLDNITECENGTNPYLEDTDNDGLTDYDELIVYLTNPKNDDTDKDLLQDSLELEYSMNPNDPDTLDDGILDGERVFTVSAHSDDYDDKDNVKPSLLIDLKGSQINSLDINKVVDDLFLTKEIPGFIGDAYDFIVDGDFESATISFEIPAELFDDPEFIPAIYYFNEATQCLEELANQIIFGNKISAKTTHFSKYIVLAKNKYEKTLFEFEILAPTDEEMQKTKFDLALVLDESGSVSSSDYKKMKNIAKDFVGRLAEEDRVAVFTFSDYVTKDSTFVDTVTASNVISSLGQDNGMTAIYDGINAANNEFISCSSSDATKIIIVLTDGYDNSSYCSYGSVTNTAVNNQIVIYTIGVGSVNTSILTKIANATGGAYYSASNYSQLGDIFDRIDIDKDLYKDSDSDGISDYHEKKIAAGEMKLGTGICVDGFEMLNYLSNDSDGDGIVDGDEFEVLSQTVQGKEVYYCKMNSNPCSKDTDYDGIKDCKDTAPLELGLKDGIIGAVKLFSNTNSWNDAGHSFITFTSFVYNTVSISAYNYQTDNYYVGPNNVLSFGLTQSQGASSSDGQNGNNRGFSVNAEIGNGGTAYYTGRVSVTREVTMKELKAIIKHFENNNYYELVNHNCATVATSAWNSVFGESFTCKNGLGLDTPAALKKDIARRDDSVVNDTFEKTITTSCDKCNGF